jgi:hypothetical protein
MRLMVLGLAIGALMAGSAVSAEAFTLIQFGKPYVAVKPTSGLPTSTLAVRGKYVWNGPCPGTAIPITFKFYWYKVITARVLLWTKTVSACTTSALDTGNSPPFTPPPGFNYPSTFVIQVAVYSATGKPFGPKYTNTTVFQVLPPKPKPRPSPKPSAQCGGTGQPACASPSPTPCANPSAALPPGGPGGQDVATILALGLVGTFPIGGIAMMLSGAVWARSRRWGRIAAMLALAVVALMSAAACTAPNQTGQETPSEVATSPSPSPTPTC